MHYLFGLFWCYYMLERLRKLQNELLIKLTVSANPYSQSCGKFGVYYLYIYNYKFEVDDYKSISLASTVCKGFLAVSAQPVSAQLFLSLLKIIKILQ